jgi:mono/diheme cytochrome c family protein
MEIAAQNPKAAALDAMFASLHAANSGSAPQMIGLPEHLGETDLVSLDSATLAQTGVIAYAPGYPLWSDNAGKLRHVRVPIGQSIHFDKAAQQFEIPPNTRFYKTFMKQIVDTDGSYRYRKIETRLIVSRPDQNNADGSVKQTALFGSYRWRDDESDAVLVQTPLNNGKPFADTLVFYNTDEQLAADLLRAQPLAPQEVLLEAHAGRHYAIPSSERCIECHMGSPSQAFILGFTPLQINRFPKDAQGVIEDTGPDELTQLQRLVEAGVITGISSSADVLPLELSQGTRTPRNDLELKAQGYALGNCVHCHNPRGFPSVQNPVLKNALDFLPTAGPVGGLFQFPLESYSPRIGRGISGSTPIPYITPSLVDLPRIDPQSGGPAADPFIRLSAQDIAWVNYAPWRSILYRNIDSAFAYTDDFALYPHMPMNTPGFDPRARTILGDWMVSIPAVRKHPELVEYAYQVDQTPAHNIGSQVVDTSPQPYVEVLPGQPGYNAALEAATQRLAIFHTGLNPALASVGTYSRYNDLGDTTDIIDPTVTADPICKPTPNFDPSSSHPYTSFGNHPHWVTTDLTQAPGPWAARQSNWANVLVAGIRPPEEQSCAGFANANAAYADQLAAVSFLSHITLDQVKPFVTTPVPYGLWQQNPGCKFTSATGPPVSTFTASAQHPHWMDVAKPPPNAPVYSETPGAAVFKMICINCHGATGEGNGRLAQNLATMSGGNALVANFHTGLFGPPGVSEENSNRHAVFGVAALQSDLMGQTLPADWSTDWAGPNITDDDRAARYMAWMGLGGTAVNIPIEVLQLVAITKVLDQRRVLAASTLSANMLSEAKSLCLSLIGPGAANGRPIFDPTPGHGYLDAKLNDLNHVLIPSNGDFEMWLQLCSLGNPPPVHLLGPSTLSTSLLGVNTIQGTDYSLSITPTDFVLSALYPSGAPVGNHRGETVDTGLDASNLWPWCVDPKAPSATPDWVAAHSQWPQCPASVLQLKTTCQKSNTAPPGTCFDNDAANAWAVRGAINAGLAVYLYLLSIEDKGPDPDYDQCSLLK